MSSLNTNCFVLLMFSLHCALQAKLFSTFRNTSLRRVIRKKSRNFSGLGFVWHALFRGSADLSCAGTFPKWRASLSPDEIQTMSCGRYGSAEPKKSDLLSISWEKPSSMKRRPTSMRRVTWICSRASRAKQKTGLIPWAKIRRFSRL